jgi:hypothetical protein
MHQESNHTATPEGAASLLVAALERTWQTIRRRHPDVPEAVLVVASGSEGKRLNLGHFAPRRWQVNGADRHEVLIGGEGLHRGPLEVLGTLLHEAAHGLAQARKLQDTSRQGRYHNRRYAALARELGLEMASVKPIGWSATTVPDTIAEAYAGELEELAAALVLWRRQEHRIGSGRRSRNLLAAACACGRKLRAARTTLQEAPIVCGLCAQLVRAGRTRGLTLNRVLRKEPAGAA